MATMVAIGKIRIKDNIRKVDTGDVPLEEAELHHLPLDEQAEIKSLAKNIESVGLIHALTVKDLGGGKSYRLIAGWRRYMAMKHLGKKTVEVKSIKGKTDDEVVLQLSENLHRSDLNPMEVAEALEAIMRIKSITKQVILAQEVNKTTGWVSQHLGLLKTDASIQESVRNGEMGIAAARALATLPKPEQPGAVSTAKKEAKGAGKNKVTTKGAKSQVSKSKKKKEGKQGTIRTVDERQVEQKAALIREFYVGEYGDQKIPQDVSKMIPAFWDFLFKKDRLYISPDAK
jgi:ParB/RepB/Spo0J family partition protein